MWRVAGDGALVEDRAWDAHAYGPGCAAEVWCATRDAAGRVLSGADDGTLKVWDPRAPGPTAAGVLTHDAGVTSVRPDPRPKTSDAKEDAEPRCAPAGRRARRRRRDRVLRRAPPPLGPPDDARACRQHPPRRRRLRAKGRRTGRLPRGLHGRRRPPRTHHRGRRPRGRPGRLRPPRVHRLRRREAPDLRPRRQLLLLRQERPRLAHGVRRETRVRSPRSSPPSIHGRGPLRTAAAAAAAPAAAEAKFRSF